TPSSAGGTPDNRGVKRKDSEMGEHGESSPNDQSPTRSSSNGHNMDGSRDSKAEKTGKRIKTARACDSCRRKKIRCDVIDDGGPPVGSINNGNGGLVCAHCRQYGFECTFFLPITETRFKKKYQREAEEAAAAAAAAAASAASASGLAAQRMGLPGYAMSYGAQPPGVMMMGGANTQHFGAFVPTQIRSSLSQEWPRKSSLNLHRPTSAHPFGQQQQTPQRLAGGSNRSSPGTPPPDTRVLGPTSIAYIVHSTAFVPGAAIEAHDIKHNQTFEVGASGDGIIRFHKPRKVEGQDAALVKSNEVEEEDEIRIPEFIKGRLAQDVGEKLINTYFDKIATLFPVVTRSEFVHLSPPSPLLLHAIYGVAALNRDVPCEVLGSIKTAINALFRENDFLSNSNSVTVRALLILSLHADLHGPTALQSGSRCWNRTGAAIRMAQDLGLHRDASGKDDLHQDTFFLEQKRRIWGCCVTADRIQSISLGHPLMIDLTDCDVRLPSPFEVLRSVTDPRSDASTDRPFAFNTEMLKLAILFGRVMKTIYSPTGLMNATDDEITSLLRDIDAWKDSLPSELNFKGPDSPPPAGILHVGFACLMMLFFRVFMRISYICPTHLKFSLTIERMSSLIQYSSEAISWVDKNDFYLDTMQIVSYCLVSCATVQYHAWIRRGDHNAQNQLKKLNEVMQRYRKENEDPDDTSMRGKAASVISLLCDSAQGVYANSPCSGSLNPTAGVTNRKSRENVRGIVFRPDASRPGGGVYVAADQSLFLKDLPQGTIIMQENQDGSRIPALVRTGTDQNGGWQTYEQFRAALLGLQKGGTAAGGSGTDQNAGHNINTSFATLNSSAALPNADGLSATNSTSGSEGATASSLPKSVLSYGSSALNSTSTGGTTNSGADGNAGSGSMANQSLAPPGSNLIHLGGDVWQDEEGRPVTRSGSRLLTMVPITPGSSGLGPAAAFGDGTFPISGGGGTQLQVARNAIMPDNPTFNFNPHLNNAYWAPAELLFDGNGSQLNGTASSAAGPSSSLLTAAGLLGSNVDSGMLLDGLPGASLDFATWDQYFSKLNQPTDNSNTPDNQLGDGSAAAGGIQNGSNPNYNLQSSLNGHGHETSNPDGSGFATSTFGIEAQMMDAGGF
ncbi:hypothetical protein BCV70DRAFT_145768, partial [Testicularia cyperi]